MTGSKKTDSDTNRILGIDKVTGARIPIIKDAKMVLERSPDCPWKYAELELCETVPYENPDLICLNPTLGMCSTETSFRTEFTQNGRTRKIEFRDRDLALMPAGDVGKWSCDDPHRTLLVSVKQDLLIDIALDAGISESVQLAFAAPMPDDDFIRSSLLALQEEAETGYRSGELYGDSLTTALAAHLLCKYSVGFRKLEQPKGGLSARTLTLVVETIKSNYMQDLSLAELSKLAYMSPYHFSRLFKNSTGMSPHQYLIHYRVKRAKELLKSGSLSLKDIATEVGFWDAGHLRRHFKRIYGISPSQIIKTD